VQGERKEVEGKRLKTVTRRECVAAILLGIGDPAARARAAVLDAQQAASERPLEGLSLVAMADALSKDGVTPMALVDAHLDRLARMEPTVHAFITVTADRARAEARARAAEPRGRRGRLFGIPIAHKDLFDTAGVRTTAGSRLYERRVPTRDAEVVARLAHAGAVSLGKTNTHELGGGVTTINPFFGTTRNPIDPTRIAGGSSGGSAAAVAAHMVAGATGSDTGGSVRIPAAFCGVVGFKPTFGRISTAGLLGSCPTFDHVGLLARSVSDVQVMYAAAIGSARGGKGERNARGMRVGVTRSLFFDGLQPAVGTAIEDVLGRLARAGAIVSDVAFPIDEHTMERVLDPIVVSEIRQHLEAAWRAGPDRFSPAFAAVFSGAPPEASAVANARDALRAFKRAVAATFDRVDVIVAPTVPVTAPLIDGPIDGDLILRNTWPMNAAGMPAVSIPCGTDAQGLPIGLQIAGPAGADELVLSAARMIESTI
jgi:aspartyl-tRNA(Asn)/glutamyl-tRNA(Gln) amidotransferase subunit A